MTTKLTTDEVTKIFTDSLFKKGEDTTGYISTDGIVHKVGFHPARLESHRQEVKEMLKDLPEGFQQGWSFLFVGLNKEGNSWAENNAEEQLFLLGLALGLVKRLTSKHSWFVSSISLPYFQVISFVDGDNKE